LFFHQVPINGQKPAFPVLEAYNVPDVRVFHRNEFEATAQSKDTLAVLAEQEIPLARLEKAYRRHRARDTTVDEITKELEVEVPTHTSTAPVDDIFAEYPSDELFNISDYLSSEFMDIVSSTPVDLPFPSEDADQPVQKMDTHCPNPEVVVSSLPRILHWNKNTTYLLCENIKQMLPPQEIHKFLDQQEDCDDPPVISFLIPPDVFSAGSQQSSASSGSPLNYETAGFGHVDGAEESPPKYYLEVTCNVVGMNYVPLHPHAEQLGHFQRVPVH